MPGHTPDSIALYAHWEKRLFVGDIIYPFTSTSSLHVSTSFVPLLHFLSPPTPPLFANILLSYTRRWDWIQRRRLLEFTQKSFKVHRYSREYCTSPFHFYYSPSTSTPTSTTESSSTPPLPSVNTTQSPSNVPDSSPAPRLNDSQKVHLPNIIRMNRIY